MGIIRKIFNHFHQDSLYRNSIYLMLSTAVMSFFGFFFWIINAHLYSPDQVGIATTLISVMTLISSLSILGFGNGLIKYIPSSENKNEKINTSFVIVGYTSILLSIIYLIFLKFLSPKLLFIEDNNYYILLFIIFAAISTITILLEDIFIAYRSSIFVLLKNSILSIFKIIFAGMLTFLGSYGIFTSVGISTIIAFIVCFNILVYKFKYIPKFKLNSSALWQMINFSLGNHVAVIISGLPATILPILISNTMGSKFSAYFYMDLMVANLLYVIPLATSQSLFAEGSYSETELKVNIYKAIKIILAILSPAIVLSFLFGNYILLAFGKTYTSEGFLLLKMFSLAGFFITINYIGSAVLNIKHKIKLNIFINTVNILIIFLLSYLFVNLKLFGIGISWIIGYACTGIMYLIVIRKLIYK
jgi:O-antigen/teichoic acid export membrane protein